MRGFGVTEADIGRNTLYLSLPLSPLTSRKTAQALHVVLLSRVAQGSQDILDTSREYPIRAQGRAYV